jgi:AAA domain
MRVAITGAHGVGKSTLAGRIADALGVPELATPGRTLASESLPVNESATVTSQAVAWLMQFRFERASRAWVSSRSLIDVWAYTVLAGDRGVSEPVEAALLRELERATPLAVTNAYDTLVYVPPVIPLVADEVRGADIAFQAAVDERIHDAIVRWRVPHETLDVSDAPAVDQLVKVLAGRTA